MNSINKKSAFLFLVCTMTFTLHLHARESLRFSISNPSHFERQEVVGISVQSIATFLKDKTENDIRIIAEKSKKVQVLQWIDDDGDGTNDQLLVYVTIPAKKIAFYILEANSSMQQATSTITTYSRFVPERTDDYAWENDKVAFRTYGPDAQKRIEEHRANGTLSSGIDLWLKRTDKSIINSWYKGYEKDPMYYHKDRGEGYDPYHVGGSRGTGGTGIWQKDSLIVSKNFDSYKTIATGPLRTVFELTYAGYSPYDVVEKKRISLDIGSNFSKFEIAYSSKKALPNYTVGISLHENQGATAIFKKQGVFVHHELIDGIYLGEAIVINPTAIQNVIINKSKTKDQSNLLVLTKAKGEITYFAGFAWGRGGQVSAKKEWSEMSKKQAEIIKKPLVIRVL